MANANQVQAPGLDQHHRIAADLVAAYNFADPDAATRLNDLFHSAIDIEQIRDFIRDKLCNLPDTQRRVDNFTLDDAQLVVARRYGFDDWNGLVRSSNEPASDPRSARVVLSSKPPFYRIDWTNNSIEPRQPMSTRDWENVCAVIKELGLTKINSASLIGDDDLQIISQLDQITSINLDGSKGLTDKGLGHLARMPQLRELTLGGQITDDGLEVLSHLRELRVFQMFWQGNITDEGITGRECPNLKESGFVALSRMPALKGLAVSCQFVDDAALASLPDFPSLKELVPMDVSDEGFRHVGRSEKLESLTLMYCRDTTDAATNHLVGMPNLQKYHAGYTLITDASLELLSRINSLEKVSFEGCKLITDAGLPFLTTLPHLRELSIGGCSKVTRSGVKGFGSTVRVNYDPF